MSTVSSWNELAVPDSYCVLDANGRVAGRVRLVSVGDRVGYGVDHDTGERVVLRPLEAYIDNGRLLADCA